MTDASWNHQYAEANGIRVHYVRHGAGTPLVLLHGWPEFWYVWRKNIGPLAEAFDVVVPDLRGFGETQKTPLPHPPSRLLDDGSFDEDLDAWVDNFMRPGNLRGGFDWYVGNAEARMKMMREGAPEQPARLETPTRFLWGESDPILKVRWADRLGDYFADYEFAPAPGAGHFVHYERPELANAEMARFFGSL